MPDKKKCSRCGNPITDYPCTFCGKNTLSGIVESVTSGCDFLTLMTFSLLVFVIIVSILVSLSGSSGLSGPEHSEVGAWNACETFVERRLKAPATADFPCCYDDFVTHEGGGIYRAESYVDAENAFGAEIRNDFTCTVEYRSGGSWRLQDIAITGR